MPTVNPTIKPTINTTINPIIKATIIVITGSQIGGQNTLSEC